jgi:hypothetical protein
MQKLSTLLKNKKGISWGNIPSVVLSLIVIVVTLVVGSIVVSNLGATTTDTNATLIVSYGQDAFATFGSWLGIMVVIILAAVIFSLFKYFGQGAEGSY